MWKSLIQELKEHQRRVGEIDEQIKALEAQKEKLNKRVPRAPFDELDPEIQIAINDAEKFLIACGLQNTKKQ